MSTPSDLTRAIVLHTRAYRNTSLLVDLFTEAHGRITVVATGVKNPKSKLRSVLQLFSPLFVSYAGKGSLLSLRIAEAADVPYQLKGTSLNCGLYMNELLIRLLQPHDPYTHLLDQYQLTLKRLAEDNDVQIPLRIFEKTLLSELGYGLSFSHDAVTAEAILPDQDYLFLPDSGFTISVVDHHNKFRMFTGEHLLAIDKLAFDLPEVLQQAKQIFRIALQHLLGSKPINSRKLFI